jgi:hypothetical protein
MKPPKSSNIPYSSVESAFGLSVHKSLPKPDSDLLFDVGIIKDRFFEKSSSAIFDNVSLNGPPASIEFSPSKPISKICESVRFVLKNL